MCLIILSYQQHADYPLIVASNRDEFYARPTAPLDWWANAPQILGGADISQNVQGAWLGTNRQGRFAAITNFRQPGKDRKDAASRGLIVRRYLEGSVSTAGFTRELIETAGNYNGFNLLFGTKDELWYYGNRSGEPPAPVSPGLHVLSNALLDTPWPKADPALTALNEVTIAIQVNGKRRDEIVLKKDLPAAEVEAAVLALDSVQRALEGAKPKKVIVVPNRIVNLVR